MINPWLRACAAGLTLLSAWPALAQQDSAAPAPQPPTIRWLSEVQAAYLAARLHAQQAAADLKSQATTPPSGLRLLQPPTTTFENTRPAWSPLAPDSPLTERAVLLVHGLDEPGPIWDDLAPELAAAGHTVLRFDYPNDQAIAASADLLAASLRDLRARGVKAVDLVCHSMGGLVARDTLTRPTLYAGRARGHADLPDIDRLIMLATPHTGAPLARFQAVADGREQIMRWADAPDHDWRRLLAFMNDGRGQAADDLLPRSAFLTDLNARPAPRDVLITSVVAKIVPAADDTDARAADAPQPPAGDEAPAQIARHVNSLSEMLGDGVVPLESAAAYTAGETVYVQATHRGLLRITSTERQLRAAAGVEPRTPPAIPIVLDRLARPSPPSPPLTPTAPLPPSP